MEYDFFKCVSNLSKHVVRKVAQCENVRDCTHVVSV